MLSPLLADSFNLACHLDCLVSCHVSCRLYRLVYCLQDPLKSRKPDPGATAGMGRAGRIGNTGGTLLTQHLLKKRGKLVATDTEMDPREAILRHADKEDDISMLTAAYAKTQPKPVFAEPEPDSDEEDS